MIVLSQTSKFERESCTGRGPADPAPPIESSPLTADHHLRRSLRRLLGLSATSMDVAFPFKSPGWFEVSTRHADGPPSHPDADRRLRILSVTSLQTAEFRSTSDSISSSWMPTGSRSGRFRPSLSTPPSEARTFSASKGQALARRLSTARSRWPGLPASSSSSHRSSRSRPTRSVPCQDSLTAADRATEIIFRPRQDCQPGLE